VSELPFEGPAEDVAEQHAEVRADPEADAPAAGGLDEVSLEADPADAQEQAAEVPIDEDEWR
jgi:hypothetical protein